MSQTRSKIYEALFELAQSISGHNDLESLCCGLARSLRRVVDFEFLGFTLHEPGRNLMRAYVLSTEGPVNTDRAEALPVEQDPTGWVWLNQQPLLISVADETRWPDFLERLRVHGVRSLMLVPLTTGDHRVGTLGFGCLAPYEPTPAETAFLQRVASEFAVTVNAFLIQQDLVRERDRLRVLFDITNALVSKLSPDELFSAISEQLSRVVTHDIAVLTLWNEATGELQLYGLHFTGKELFRLDRKSGSPEGLPAAEAIATRRPVVVTEPDFNRFRSPYYREMESTGFRAGCSVPMLAHDRVLGTLEIARASGEAFTESDVDLLVQVAGQIAIAVENSLSYREVAELRDKLATEKLYLEDEIRSDQNIGNMVGESLAFQSVLKSVQVVAPTDATVLILGETGTGKELVARAIHELSGRSKGSFVKVNCASIPSSLLESELFGHEKGAFTGAVAQKIGRFELAHHGTMFLDEIGELPLELQSKLLRAIQEQEFERLGGNRTIKVDVRFVAATNRDLKAMVQENKFRSDLYYRLHVFPFQVPSLRERREDIPLLTRYFVQKYAQRMNRRIDSIPAAALDALTRYDWPGNIRELQNVIERSVILTHGSSLTVAMPELMSKGTFPHVRTPEASQAAERDSIVRALREAQGVVGGAEGAAARLGLKRTTLQSRMRKLRISREYR